jgi:hypothetical protein
MRRTFTIICLVSSFALSLAGTRGFAQPSAPAPQAPTSDASIHGYGDRDKTCVAWTDQCRACVRDGDTITCSNIGIACQPAAITCSLRKAEPAK